MSRRRITKRWLFNSFGVILLVLIAIEIFSAFGLRSYYYSGVKQSIVSRADLVEGLLKSYASDASVDFFSEVRTLVENFEDKDKMEVMVLDLDGNVLITSSGFEPSKNHYMPDYLDAVESGLEGDFQGSLYGENVYAFTRLTQPGGQDILAVRYVTSLTNVDKQIIALIALITLAGMAVIVFVIISSTYFINSIIVPLGKVGQTARKIAGGDFSIRLEKQNDDEIGELVDIINYMAAELDDAEKMKNDFISSVSHELRTPLTAIKGWAETLSGEEQLDAQTLKKGMGVIIKESERLSGMVEELLDFSRMQSGRMSMVIDRMDLVAELSEAVLMYDQRARRDHVSLSYEEPEEMLAVMGDHNRLRQVFVNIIDNAIKHTPRGGKVMIVSEKSGSDVVVRIADNGEGIKKEDLPFVKNKFFKGDSTKRGSGIGLAIADEIIAQHGGTLEVTSVYGKGTIVTITLPVAGKKAEAEITEIEGQAK